MQLTTFYLLSALIFQCCCVVVSAYGIGANNSRSNLRHELLDSPSSPREAPQRGAHDTRVPYTRIITTRKPRSKRLRRPGLQQISCHCTTCPHQQCVTDGYCYSTIVVDVNSGARERFEHRSCLDRAKQFPPGDHHKCRGGGMTTKYPLFTEIMLCCRSKMCNLPVVQWLKRMWVKRRQAEELLKKQKLEEALRKRQYKELLERTQAEEELKMRDSKEVARFLPARISGVQKDRDNERDSAVVKSSKPADSDELKVIRRSGSSFSDPVNNLPESKIDSVGMLTTAPVDDSTLSSENLSYDGHIGDFSDLEELDKLEEIGIRTLVIEKNNEIGEDNEVVFGFPYIPEKFLITADKSSTVILMHSYCVARC